MSSGQKDGGLSAAVMCSAAMCPAAKWVDTLQTIAAAAAAAAAAVAVFAGVCLVPRLMTAFVLSFK